MTVDEIYSGIAQKIVGAIDFQEWSRAELVAQLMGGATEFSGTVYSDGNKVGYFKIHHELFDLFEELQEIMSEGSKVQWNTAVFNLNADGEFSVNFDWDQELYEEIKSLSK